MKAHQQAKKFVDNTQRDLSRLEKSVDGLSKLVHRADFLGDIALSRKVLSGVSI